MCTATSNAARCVQVVTQSCSQCRQQPGVFWLVATARRMICALQLQQAVAKLWHMLCLCYIVLLGKHGTGPSAMPWQTQPVTSLAQTSCM